MICNLKFVYFDNKDVTLTIKEESLGNLFTSLNQKQMYFDEINKMGFWTDLDKIRYIHSLFYQEDVNAKPEESASHSSIPSENETSACCA